jgi:hypothetical protein
MHKEYKLTIYSILTGILITLITALFPNVFLLGVSYWGYFLPWIKKIVYPGAPIEIMWINFFANIVIWSVFMYLTFIGIEEKPKKRARKR